MTQAATAGAPGAELPTDNAKSSDPRMVGEWFWRFLGVVMLAVVGWVAWIAYQLNPAPLATPAAFEAAAKARTAASAPAVAPVSAVPVAPDAEPPGPAIAAPGPGEAVPTPVAANAPSEAPVQMEKLKLSDTLTTAAEVAKGGSGAK